MDPRPTSHPARLLGLVAVLLVAALLVAGQTSPAAAGVADDPAVVYEPPVDAPVVDPFRPPPHPYGAGNRGLEYGTAPGTPVRAAAPGRVVFAGPVGGSLHVTVLHPDGLRSTSSHLGTVAVRRGQAVHRGDVLGTAGPGFHFGVRDGDDRYLDPAALFAGAPVHARLVPVPGEEGGAAAERAAISAWMRAERPGLLQRGLDWFEDRLAELDDRYGALAEVGALADPTTLVGSAARAAGHVLDAPDCTDPGTAPPRIEERRIALLVGGLGSTSEHAAVDEVRTDELGYRPGDVYRFSYAGGRVPDPGDAEQSVPATRYRSEASQQDLRASARRLAELIAELARARPQVPIDLVAHSQGGVVARLALDELATSGAADAVGSVVTLGTPHRGADLASAAGWLTAEPARAGLASTLADLAGTDLRAHAPAVGQLAVTSELIDELRGSALPDGVRLTSIAARGDLVVPSPRSRLDDHTSVVLPLDAATSHSDLPGSSEATREIALALAGAAPTCESVLDVLLDHAGGQVVQAAEALIGPVAVAASSVPG